MTKKDFFENEDKKYKAIEKEEKIFSKPKKETEVEHEFEEVKSDSSYEMYEGLDNVNSFNIKKQNKVKSFLLRLLAFQNFVNLFLKLLTKFIIFLSQNELISRKFLGKFSSKLQKLLLKILLVFQMKLLLLQFSILIIKSRIYSKILQRIKEQNHSKILSFSEKKIEKENVSRREFVRNNELFEKSDLFKNSSLYSLSPSQNLRFFESSISELKRNFNFSSFELEKSQENFILKQSEHGGRDYFSFRIESSKILASNYISQSFDILQYIINSMKRAVEIVKDFIVDSSKNKEVSQEKNFSFVIIENISRPLEKEKLNLKNEEAHVFKIENISENSSKMEGRGFDPGII